MKSKILSYLCWAVQILLSVTLLWAGYTKLFTPGDKLAEMWPWTADNKALVIITGILDIAGGLGVILPSVLKIKAQLTVYAAAGTALLMTAAAIFHILRGEISETGINALLLLLALFVIGVKTRK